MQIFSIFVSFLFVSVTLFVNFNYTVILRLINSLYTQSFILFLYTSAVGGMTAPWAHASLVLCMLFLCVTTYSLYTVYILLYIIIIMHHVLYGACMYSIICCMYTLYKCMCTVCDICDVQFEAICH